MKVKIALAGNPNSGKTTLFNALTGSYSLSPYTLEEVVSRNFLIGKNRMFTTSAFGIGTIAAFILVIGFFYLLFRPCKESQNLSVPKSVSAKIRA